MDLIEIAANLRKEKEAKPPTKLVSFTFPTADACMMQALAEHFEVSVSKLGAQMFAHMVGPMFDAMPAEEKAAIAERADAAIRKHVKSTPKDKTSLTRWRDSLNAE